MQVTCSYGCILIAACILFLSVKIAVFWYVMPYSMVDGYWHSGGTCCLHNQGRRICSIPSYVEDRGSKFIWVSVTTYQTTRHHMPEHINAHNSTVRTSDIMFVNGRVAIKLWWLFIQLSICITHKYILYIKIIHLYKRKYFCG